MSKWVKFSDNMPDANKPVLVYYLTPLWKNPVNVVAINFDGTGKIRAQEGGSQIGNPTHWMTLPEPPQE